MIDFKAALNRPPFQNQTQIMSKDFTLNFSLFDTDPAKRTKVTSPHRAGSIEIPVDQIDALIAHLGTKPEEDYKGNPVVKLTVLAYNNESKAGKKYIGGKVLKPLDNSNTPAQGNQAETDLW